MRAADRMRRIELETDLPVANPASEIPPHRGPTDRGQGADAPFQKTYVELFTMPREPGNETAEP